MADHTAGGAAGVMTDNAGDQSGSLPILTSDPERSDLPTDQAGDRVALLYLANGGATGSSGDLVVAAPNASGGVDVTVAVALSATITLSSGGAGGL